MKRTLYYNTKKAAKIARYNYYKDDNCYFVSAIRPVIDIFRFKI